MQMIRIFLIGILIGISNVIPGVSGGTIALVFNIYDDLMDCITLNFKRIIGKANFLIPLGIGILVGIAGFSKIMELLFINFPMQTYFAFIGIIFGSLPFMFKKITETASFKLTDLVPIILGIIPVVALYLMDGDKTSGSVVFTTLTVTSFIVLFLSAAVAAATMVIPGISGSMILIIIGMYQTIMFEAVTHRNFALWPPIVLGILTGLLLGAKLIKWLLAKFPKQTYLFIVGLLLGSAYQLVGDSHVNFSLTFVISLVIMVITGVLTYITSKGE